jgi:hypothetical protein
MILETLAIILAVRFLISAPISLLVACMIGGNR